MLKILSDSLSRKRDACVSLVVPFAKHASAAKGGAKSTISSSGSVAGLSAFEPTSIYDAVFCVRAPKAAKHARIALSPCEDVSESPLMRKGLPKAAAHNQKPAPDQSPSTVKD